MPPHNDSMRKAIVVNTILVLILRIGSTTSLISSRHRDESIDLVKASTPLFRRRHDSRQLQPSQQQQNEKFVSMPNIHWKLYRLNMDYIVSESLPDEMLEFGVYSDKNCQREIPKNDAPVTINFIREPVVEEEVANGFRAIRLTFLVNPESILDAPYVSHDGIGPAVVSFCTRVWTKKSEFSSEADFLRENHVLMEVILNQQGGIIGLREDSSSQWAVETFLCDSEYKEITGHLRPTSQGERIRLCVVPTTITGEDGIYLSAIKYFEFRRDSRVQSVVSNGQVVNDETTDMLCPSGSTLCVIETVLDNQFIHSRGTVEVSGTVALQFGYGNKQRSILRKPVTTDIHRTKVENDRALYEVGESVGEKSVSYFIGVAPSEISFKAEAFRCSHRNEPIDEEASALQLNDPVRICIQPDAEGRSAGVVMSGIKNFVFSRDDGPSQVAVDTNGMPAEDSNSLVICRSGGSQCYVKTQLEDWFFVTSGTVIMSGEVDLQFGSTQQTTAPTRSRNLESEVDFDPDSAGSSHVETRFSVVYSPAARRAPVMWWHSSPTYLQILYAIVVAIASLICLCCSCGCLYFCCQREKAKEFIMNELLYMDVKEIDDSVDARMDSKASFYSDLEFDTDASGNSSDEESITESFEEDLEAYACAILFPANPNPEDLSKSLGGSKPRPIEPRRTISMPRDEAPSSEKKITVNKGASSLPGRDRSTENRSNGQYSQKRAFSQTCQRVDSLTPSDQGHATISNSSRPSLPKTKSDPARRRGNKIDPLTQSIPVGQSRSISPHRRPQRQNSAPRRTTSREIDISTQSVYSNNVNTREATFQDGYALHARRYSPASRTRGPQQLKKRIPKGRKSEFNCGLTYDGKHHPGGITQIPRAELIQVRPSTFFVATPENAGETNDKKGGTAKVQNQIGTATDNQNIWSNSKKNKKSKKKKKKKKNGQRSGDEDKGRNDVWDTEPVKSFSGSSKSSSATHDSTKEKEGDNSSPKDKDVCFEAEDHPGTEAFIFAVRCTLEAMGPAAYSPKIYRHIKRQLPGRRFFVCDDDDKPYEWREVTKSELIDLFWTNFEEAKSKMFGVSIED